MKRIVLPVLLLIFMSVLVSAQSLEIEKIEKSSTIITEIGNPIEYTLRITNNGTTSEFEIYTFAGFTMTPEDKFTINSGETINIGVKAYANEDILETTKGSFVIEYQIRNSANEITKDKLRVNIIDLEDLLEIIVEDITPQQETAEISVRNKENLQLNDISISIISPFFESENIMTISPKETKKITIELNKEKQSKLIAGNYVSTVDIEFQEEKTQTFIPFNYLEKEGLAVYTNTEGVIIRETTIEKKNTGNTALEATAIKKLNLFSRLFTTFSEKPISSSKNGFFVEYVWQKELAPGESLKIVTKTNYTLPFIIMILIILVVLAVKIYLETTLNLKKHVSLVKTKGSEFALRVVINVKAKKHLDNIQIIDRIPQMAKLYDKFGIKPDKMDPQTRRIFWNIKSLNAGEERVFSYIIYSKIKIVGKFELPAATAIYEKDGKTHEVYSNTTNFATETVESDKDIF